MTAQIYLHITNKLHVLALFGLFAFLLTASHVKASSIGPSTPTAHLVSNILNYVHWPHSPHPIRLCIVPPSSSTQSLLALSNNASLRTQLQLPDATELKANCDFIYIGDITSEIRQNLLSQFIGQPILTLTESSEGCSEGSLFCTRQSISYLSFTVNLDAVARSNLHVHPQVLNLGSRKVAEPTP